MSANKLDTARVKKTPVDFARSQNRVQQQHSDIISQGCHLQSADPQPAKWLGQILKPDQLQTAWLQQCRKTLAGRLSLSTLFTRRQLSEMD